MKNNKVFKVCLTGIMAAIIAVFTAFVKIPTGINEGYVHVGDSMIYIASCLLGPLGIVSAAIGGALADILAGAAIWAIPTAIIKALNALPFVLMQSLYKKKTGGNKIINKYSSPMVLVSGVITIGGYYIAEGLMYSWASALTSVPFSIIQAVGSAIVFVLVGLALDAVKIQKFFR